MHNMASSGASALFEECPSPQSNFAEVVIAGFSSAQKVIPARFLYDERGSQLFEEITRAAEYYPTRAEVDILRSHAADIARLTSRGRVLVEFGSGSSAKTPVLLDQVEAAAYVAIDISEHFLQRSVLQIREKYPFLDVLPVGGDFMQPITLPLAVRGKRALGFFPGSTIGNATPAAAASMLRAFATSLGPDAYLAIGFDLKKDRRTLESAYNDAAGITAAFNLNLLQRMNGELHADIPISAFEHRAVWREDPGRVEMHLVATREVHFRVAGCFFRMGVGETIHTENSYKYSIAEAQLLARVSGWEPLEVWTDTQALFSFHLWRLAPSRLEP